MTNFVNLIFLGLFLWLIFAVFLNKCNPVVINITDIATLDPVQGWYELFADYTITACQILNITSGQFRIPPTLTLTNLGTITIANLDSSIQTYNNTESTGGTINNIGSITISSGAYIININNGSGSAGGIINNSGSIVIGNGINTSFISNQNNPPHMSPSPGYGGGIIKNTGTITINVGGEIDNRNLGGTVGGYIYTYGGGVTQNNGSILNTGGLVSTANGLSTCGTGTFTGTAPSGGTINTVCPP